MTDSHLTWCSLRSATRMEKKAERHLREQGFAAYMPALTHWVRHARTKEAKRQALFPGWASASSRVAPPVRASGTSAKLTR